MISRFNPTDRRKILRSHASFVLHEHEGAPPSWDATFKLSDFESLGSDTEVIVEAYDEQLVMRFFCGSVTEPKLPEDRDLTEFSPGQRALFRVKVVGLSDEYRRLLAWGNSFRPMLPEEAASGARNILPLVREDLGDELWRISWSDDEPRLAINDRVTDPDLSQIARTGADFQGLVFPAAVRIILEKLLFGDLAPPESDDESEEASGENEWISFAANQLGAGPKPDINSEDEVSQEEGREWIERAAKEFARRHRARTNYVEYKQQDS